MDLATGLAQQTLDALTLSVGVLNSEGEIIATNRAWQQFGRNNDIQDSSGTIGQNYLDVTELSDDEYAERASEGIRAVSEGKRETFELEYPCHSPSEERWFLMHVSLFEADNERYTVVAHENITDRKQAEKEVERRNNELEAFARMLSHDLRGPLNVAEGQAELLSEETDSERVGTIQSALSRISGITGDALSFLRSDTRSIARTTVSLRSVSQEAWTSMTPENARLNVEDTNEIQADIGLLRSVFENLFRNAIEHGGSDVTITVGPLENGFYVEDDGAGIPEDEREEVFEIGFTTNPDGTGFGLGIIQRIIEKHGWEIELKTSQTGGTRFEIYTHTVPIKQI